MVSSGMRGRLRTWLGGPAPARRADLSERSGFFLDLLDGTHRWRERLVEELRFESRTHVRVVSSYQIDFPPDLLAQYVDLDAVDRLNVMLPLTTRDKAPLINFALSGPGGAPASLMSRASTAGLQSQYLDLLGRTSAAEGLPEMVPARLCEAVSAFTPGRYRDRFLNASRDHEVALLAYLRSGVGPFLDGESISRTDVSRWRDSTSRAGAILARALGEHLDPLSSADELLLALPGLDPPPTAVAQIDAIVERYLAGIQAAEGANDEVFLATLAEYGRRYEVVVEVELPLLESATVKMEEDLPLRLPRRPRGWIAQAVPLGDARSVHLEARVLDSGVEIAGFELRDEDGNDASGWIESVRHTREALAIYSAEPDRPYHATLRLRLVGAWHVAATALVLTVANLAALAAIFFLPDGDALSIDRLAVLAIPTTVAAAVVLIRDQTALATRLQWRGSRAVLALSTVALWIALTITVLTYQPGSGDPTGPSGSEIRVSPRGR